MKHRLILLTLLLMSVLLLTCVHDGSWVARTESGGTQSHGRVVIEARTSPKVMVRLDSVIASRSDEQTAIKYRVTNQTQGQLKTVEMLALVVGKNGEVKGGEGWRENQLLLAASTEEFLHVMKAGVDAGDRIVLTAWRARGDAGTFEIDKNELDNFLEPRGMLKHSSGVRYVKAVQSGVEYCRGWYEYAASKCPCGVKSFSCDPKNGNFSWTCFTASESKVCAVGSEP